MNIKREYIGMKVALSRGLSEYLNIPAFIELKEDTPKAHIIKLKAAGILNIKHISNDISGVGERME